MRFGTNIFANVPLTEVVAWAGEADAAGFEIVGIPDSPLLVRESYTACTAIASATNAIGVAPMVTNPLTRHPSVVASALLSLDELAPGRVSVTLGTGDSAVHMVGLPSGRLAEVREYIAALRGLLAGEEVTWQGSTFALRWPGGVPENDVKIWMSCHGPKSMEIAGATADGVISGFGVRPENITFAKEHVAEGARAAGRDPADVEIWWHPIVTLAPARDAEVLIGLSVHFLLEHGLEGKQVPEELHEPLRVMHREMGEYHGSDQFSPALAARAKDLGVYDYLLEREGGFVGSAQDIRDRVVALGEAGAENLILAPLR